MKIFTNPAEAIEDIKNKEKTGKAILILLIGCIVLGIAILIFSHNSNLLALLGTTGSSGIILISVVVATFAFGLFEALVTKIVMKGLTGKSDYAKGLYAIAFPNLVFSIGLVIVSLLLLPVNMFSTIIAYLMAVLTIALTLTIYFKMLKELFKTDSATTLIAAIIVCVATVIAIYVLIFGSKTLLSSIMSNSLQNTGTSGLGSLGTIIS